MIWLEASKDFIGNSFLHLDERKFSVLRFLSQFVFPGFRQDRSCGKTLHLPCKGDRRRGRGGTLARNILTMRFCPYPGGRLRQILFFI